MEIAGLEQRCADKRAAARAGPGGEGAAVSLPVLPSPKARLRPSRASRWRAGVLIGIHVLFAAHVAHYLAAGRTVSPLEPSEGMEAVKHNIINTGAVFFLVAILATLVFGRFFCGWGCHVIALQDLASWLLGRIGIRPKPMRSRLLLWVPMAAFLYMFVWPAVYRAGLFVSEAIGHARAGMSLTAAAAEAWAHPLVFPDVQLHLVTDDFWKTMPGLGIGLLTLIVCGFGVVYLLGAKGYCTYACPYGAIFAVADRFAPGRIRVTDACEGCGHCTGVCTSNVRVHEEVRDYGMVVNPGCMKCLDCVSVCPNEALYFGFGSLPAPGSRPAAGKTDAAHPGGKPEARSRKPAPARATWGDYRWPQELLLGVLFVAAFFIFRGLYGLVPFLFTLGLAGMAAYIGERTVTMFLVPNMTMHGIPLKRRGRLVAGGLGLCAAALVIAAFLAHSAFIRWNQSSGEKNYERTASARDAILRPGYDARTLDANDAALMSAAKSSLDRVERWGLLAQPDVNVRLAYLALALGGADEFERRLGRALIDFPRDPSIRADLGEFLAQHNRPVEALGLFREAALVAPAQVRGHMSLGLLLASMGRFDESLAAFDAGCRAVPDSHDLAFAAGVAAANAGDAEGAIRRFARAVELRPDAIPARENLIGLYLAAGRDADAERELLRLTERAPTNEPAWRALADLARRRGDEAAARDFEERASRAAAP